MAEVPRPLLLPQNRKIRHLRGIYLRNLSFDRTQGRTTDDSAVKHSPSKLDSLRENSQLHHSASTESLRPASARRRSTNLGNATPVTRQKQVDFMIDSRVADAFFSLHSDGEEDPIYVSETVQRSTVSKTSGIDISCSQQPVCACLCPALANKPIATPRTSTSVSLSYPESPVRLPYDHPKSQSRSGPRGEEHGHCIYKSRSTCAGSTSWAAYWVPLSRPTASSSTSLMASIPSAFPQRHFHRGKATLSRRPPTTPSCACRPSTAPYKMPWQPRRR